jgi:tRNA G18 (ribose-2'-O)-methylase SpoU
VDGKGERIALEGAFLIERAISHGLRIEALYCVPARESWARLLLGESLEPTLLPEGEISAIAGYPFHRGALAFALRPPASSPAEALGSDSGPATILVLPATNDPENLGSIFRSAAALGCSAILLGRAGPDPLCRRVLRVSMGASLSLPWARLSGPEELLSLAEPEGGATGGFVTAACVLDRKAMDLRSWTRPWRSALLFGNEAFGLEGPWLEACRLRLTLPMRGGMDSLNVATAAAIFLYSSSG